MAAMKKAMKKAAAHAAPAAHPAMKKAMKAKAMKAMKKWKMVQWSWSPKRLKTSWVEHFKHCETISGFWEVLQAFWCSPHLSTQKISSINQFCRFSSVPQLCFCAMCQSLQLLDVLPTHQSFRRAMEFKSLSHYLETSVAETTWQPLEDYSPNINQEERCDMR